MITTILVEYPWLTTVVLVGMIILGPIVGAWLVSRPRITEVLLALSILLVLLFTLIPTDRELKIGCAVQWSFPTLGAIELMANVILFVPVVLLAGVKIRRPFAMLLAGSVVSVLIELVQAFVTPLGRSCSTNDWLSNTIGAALGAVLAVLALWLGRRSKPQ